MAALRRTLASATAVVGLVVATAVASPAGAERSAASSVAAEEPGATSAAPSPRDAAVAECLATDRPLYVGGPDAKAPWLGNQVTLGDRTAVDARGIVFDNSDLDDAGFGLGVRLRAGFAGADMCLVGGTIRTTLDPEETSWNTWHRVTAVPIEAPGATIVGMAFRNQGDVLAFLTRAADWRVVGVRVDGGDELPGGYAHDDCIENDAMHAGVVQDSKFDGCFTFFSSMQNSMAPVDGGANEVVITGTLVRLQPFRNSFEIPKYGENGHGGFFKWVATDNDVVVPPKLSVTDSVFRSDTPARYGGNENGFLGLPNGTRCERVTLIGTESWPEEDLASWQAQCTDLRLGTVADWDAAVAAWDAANPPLRSVPAQGRDRLARSFGW